MRISDWSSDVCSSDLQDQDIHARIGTCGERIARQSRSGTAGPAPWLHPWKAPRLQFGNNPGGHLVIEIDPAFLLPLRYLLARAALGISWHGSSSTPPRKSPMRSEEHTSELQSLMRISYAVFCLKKKINNNTKTNTIYISHNKRQSI